MHQKHAMIKVIVKRMEHVNVMPIIMEMFAIVMPLQHAKAKAIVKQMELVNVIPIIMGLIVLVWFSSSLFYIT